MATFTELLSQKSIKILLTDYSQKSREEIINVPINSAIRYFTKKGEKWKFCLGGLLINKNLNKGYIVLTNYGKTFSVQLSNSIIFVKKKIDIDKYEAQIAKLDEEIEEWKGNFPEPHHQIDDILDNLSYAPKENNKIEDAIKRKFYDKLKYCFLTNPKELHLGNKIFCVNLDLSKLSIVGKVVKIIKKNNIVTHLLLHNNMYSENVNQQLFWKINCNKYYIFRKIELSLSTIYTE